MQRAVSHTIDLHHHTQYSDGSLSLLEVVEHAKNHGVKQLAITDHDSIGAHIEWQAIRQEVSAVGQSGNSQDIHIIPGIEISCSTQNREVHIVGLNVDIHSLSLRKFVQSQQDRRRVRLLAYAEKLESLGKEGVVEAVEQLTAESVTRTHLAQILVDKGWVPDSARAFKRYIGRKARAYVPIEWPSLSEAVDVIQSAGGVAVIAHPGRYQLNRKQLVNLMEEFAESGGKAIELSYPNAEPQMIRWLTEKALSYDLMGSQGSDFHNPEWKWVKPGHFPPLPKAVTPVWTMWSE